MIKGPEYGLDIVNDLDGKYRGVSVKQKLAMRSGETDKAITVDNADIRGDWGHYRKSTWAYW